MGVPQFFHWLVTHFEDQILQQRRLTKSRTEYLYLDFNCGIHPAVKQPHLTELPEMYDAVCEYLRTIIKEVKPTKMVYIAIDGVAPNAKMKQQRSRRFKTIQEKREKDKIDRKHRRWKDSKNDFNMISPGTLFMEQLSEELEKCIALLRQDTGLEIILDDASHPGEGEHKITHHIRTVLMRRRVKESDVPKITIYGLDSDLIFLSLLHYQADFCLFREQIFFGRKPPKDTNSNLPTGADLDNEDDIIDSQDDDVAIIPKFTYLNVGALRKIILAMMDPHIDVEDVKQSGLLKMKNFIRAPNSIVLANINNPDWVLGNKELEKHLIIDYVASSFILGNDFLPHLPSLKIKEGGLNRVIECYKEVQQELLGEFLVIGSENSEGYLKNEPNIFNNKFLIALLKKLKQYEESDLLHHQKESNIRQSRFPKMITYRTNDPYERDVMIWEYVENQYEDILKLGESGWEDRYYKYYLGEKAYPDHPRINQMCHNYLEGMTWMLRYYQGNRNPDPDNFIATCPKWDWSYHFRNAPTLGCLIKYLKDPTHKVSEIIPVNTYCGKPVNHKEQLLCILPPQSNALLPSKIGKLMTQSDSPIIQYYPIDFEIDVQNKRYRWECYPILPNLDLNHIRKVLKNI